MKAREQRMAEEANTDRLQLQTTSGLLADAMQQVSNAHSSKQGLKVEPCSHMPRAFALLRALLIACAV
jgi:hypothetical protein